MKKSDYLRIDAESVAVDMKQLVNLMNIDKLMADIQKVKPGRYDCGARDLLSICEVSGRDSFNAASNCFKFGFLQGQKAARAEARREKRQRLERDKTGWYDYLSRWLERNIDNERLLRVVGVRARNAENIIKEAAHNDQG